MLHPKYLGYGLNEEEFQEAVDTICCILDGKVPMAEIAAEICNLRVRSGRYKSKVLWAASEKIGQGEQDPSAVSWWEGFCQQPPSLKAVQIFLMIPATTAASERNWSVWGRVHSKTRNRLSLTETGKLVYVNHNLALLQAANCSQH